MSLKWRGYHLIIVYNANAYLSELNQEQIRNFNFNMIYIILDS